MHFSIRRQIQQRLSREEGTYHKRGGALRLGLAYPNRYFFGMSNLGFQTLYSLFNQIEDVSCERLFLPDDPCMPYHRAGSLTTYEQGTAASQLDAVAFSISYQNDYLNLIPMLNLMGIRARADARSSDLPLIFAGGPAVTINPEPIADFCDFLVIGEGEDIVLPIANILRQLSGKHERLQALDRLEGVYVPSLFGDPQTQLKSARKASAGFGLISKTPNGKPQSGRFIRRLVMQNPHRPLAHSTVLTPETEFGDLYLLEVQRGCQWGCRFCAAGFMYRYPRYSSFDLLKLRIDHGLKYRKKLGLIAGDLLGHEDIHEILAYIEAQGGAFSPASVRLNAFTPSIIRFLHKSGNKTIAIAPEAGSERLRLSLNKTFTDDETVAAAVTLAEGGIRHIKLYIMIGLPTEDENDIEELCRLTLRTREALTRYARRSAQMPSLTLSVSPFTPKPSTPLQYKAFAGIAALKTKVATIRKRLLKHGHIQLSGESNWDAAIETLLSRGDRRVSEFLWQAAAPDGQGLRALETGRLRRLWTSLSFDPEIFVTQEFSPQQPMPWDFIDHGIKPPFIERELDKFGRQKITHYCMPERCRSCGVC